MDEQFRCAINDGEDSLMINEIMRGLTEKMEFSEGRSVAGYNSNVTSSVTR